jgi:hypothetical protein
MNKTYYLNKERTSSISIDILDREYLSRYTNNTSKFNFGCAIYPCCSRHMRFELQAIGFGKAIDIFSQVEARRTARVFLICQRVKQLILSKFSKEED